MKLHTHEERNDPKEEAEMPDQNVLGQRKNEKISFSYDFMLFRNDFMIIQVSNPLVFRRAGLVVR